MFVRYRFRGFVGAGRGVQGLNCAMIWLALSPLNVWSILRYQCNCDHFT